MENATTGHSTVAGGLRGHSMGDTYPLTVIGLGNGYASYNLLTGETGPVRPTYNAALFWKELDEACPRACPRTVTRSICHACTWFTADNLKAVRAAQAGIGGIRLGLLKGVTA